MITVSVIIPVLNQWNLTAACLRALAAHSPHTVEVIVVDNASTDDTPLAAPPLGRELFGKSFSYLRQEKNLNFGPASNLGARHASGEFLYFLNNDTEICTDWHNTFCSALQEQYLGATGPLLLYPQRRVQHAGIVFTTHMTTRHLGEFYPPEHPLVQKTRPLQSITAAALFMRRKLFLELEGFYPGFQNGGEDVDLCARIARMGLTMRLCPSVRVVHHTSQTEGRFDHDPENARLLDSRQGDFFRPDYHHIMTDGGYAFFLTPWLDGCAGLTERDNMQKTHAFRRESASNICAELEREPLWRGGYALAEEKIDDRETLIRLSLERCRFFPEPDAFERLAKLTPHLSSLQNYAQAHLRRIQDQLARPEELWRKARFMLGQAKARKDQVLTAALENWLSPK